MTRPTSSAHCENSSSKIAAASLVLCAFVVIDSVIYFLLHLWARESHTPEIYPQFWGPRLIILLWMNFVYLCIGLALMKNERSTELIRSVVHGAIRRPKLLQQAAIALGKLGDKSVTNELQDMLVNDPSRNLAKLSAISSALGFIGDRRTIGPLTAMLHDESITDLSRAFAAVALGGVADKEPLPWNSKIAVNLNYRAAVETLTNGSSGILDIL